MRGWTEILKLSWKEFLALGRENPNDDNELFCMTILALKFSAYANGVAALHGVVSREMWKHLWPGLPLDEVPIGHVTNGVHPRTWISRPMLDLLDRYFGPRFEDKPTEIAIWDRIDRISDEELWRTHERRRDRFVAFVRERLRAHYKRIGATTRQMAAAEDALSPYALTLCFARRFATYKRGNLLFRDPDRLLRLLKNTEQPLQLVFAGKAHPHDIPGKELIKTILHFAEQYNVQSRIIFIENYDMTVARYMTSGGDVWLNTPRRPLEASGTSGMKAAMNGVLNCSVLDGWWDEACNPGVGWAIGHGEVYRDEALQDDVESEALYDLLEREIIPIFYTRGRDGLPREWIKMMKNSMKEIGRSMCSHRMLMDYSNNFYIPALKNHRRILRDDYIEAKSLAAYFGTLSASWNNIRITRVESTAKPVMQRGDSLSVKAFVELAGLKPDQVQVELYYGNISNQTKFIEHAEKTEMRCTGQEGGLYKFGVRVECMETGFQGHTVRILPKHPALVHPYRPGFIKWA
jgi:starch phosphorylase